MPSPHYPHYIYTIPHSFPHPRIRPLAAPPHPSLMGCGGAVRKEKSAAKFLFSAIAQHTIMCHKSLLELHKELQIWLHMIRAYPCQVAGAARSQKQKFSRAWRSATAFVSRLQSPQLGNQPRTITAKSMAADIRSGFTKTLIGAGGSSKHSGGGVPA